MLSTHLTPTSMILPHAGNAISYSLPQNRYCLRTIKDRVLLSLTNAQLILHKTSTYALMLLLLLCTLTKYDIQNH